MDVFVYEFGYMLGLWYVYYGVIDLDCIDDCVEIFFLFELGDLCFDINFILVNSWCWDFVVNKLERMCGVRKFVDIFFLNYMSYIDDFCIDLFLE